MAITIEDHGACKAAGDCSIDAQGIVACRALGIVEAVGFSDTVVRLTLEHPIAAAEFLPAANSASGNLAEEVTITWIDPTHVDIQFHNLGDPSPGSAWFVIYQILGFGIPERTVINPAP